MKANTEVVYDIGPVFRFKRKTGIMDITAKAEIGGNLTFYFNPLAFRT